METFWAIVLTIGAIYGICWLITTYIGWTVVMFLIFTFLSICTFYVQATKDKTAPFDLLNTFIIFAIWVCSTTCYWIDVLNPIHPFYTCVLTFCVTFVPLILAWVISNNRSWLRSFIFLCLAGPGLYIVLTFPILKNDYHRFFYFEKFLSPIMTKTLLSHISDEPLPVSYPYLIVEQRQRTPNENITYSEFNEKITPGMDKSFVKEINSIIFLRFYFTTYANYTYTVRRPGSSPYLKGDTESLQHNCQIYIYSMEKKTKYLYKTITGPVPQKPVDSNKSYGERIDDSVVITELNLLLKNNI